MRNSEEKFRTYAENVPGVVSIYTWFPGDKVVFHYQGPGLEEIIGKKLAAKCIDDPQEYFKLIPKEDREKLEAAAEIAIKNNEPLDTEYRLQISKDEFVWIRSRFNVTCLPEGALFWQGIIYEITEHKQAENIQKALYNISNALNTTDNMHDLYKQIKEFLGNIIDTTNFYVALYDEKTDMISLPFDVDEKDNSEAFPAGKTLTKYVIDTGNSLLVDDKLLTKLIKEGKVEDIGAPSEIWLGVPLKVENQVIGVIAVQSYDDPNLYTEKDIDILTYISEAIALAIDKKRAEEQIKKDLKLKNILLQEVHHRVKNNMQVISSMLKLQSHYVEDEKALELFRNSQNRVKSMALIQDALYRSQDLANINFADYVTKLTTQIFSSYGINSNDIQRKIEIKDTLMDVNMAIPCGLIINELVSNSLSHAFPEGRKGEINISLIHEGGIFTLFVKDNGIGISGEIDLENSPTLGLLLVHSLTKQLNAKLELEKVKGTSFKIIFKEIELKTFGKV